MGISDLRVTDASGSTTTFTYDLKGRALTATDSQGNVTSYQYDAAGNRIVVTDANHNSTRYEYDHKGRVVSITDALGQVSVLTYGSAGCATCGDTGQNKPTSLTDANGNATFFNYDSLGRLSSETDPSGKQTTYAYDATGRIASRTDANGNTINYSYDKLGRLLKKSLPDGGVVYFDYDLKGRLIAAANADISYTMEYDVSGRLLKVSDSLGRDLSYTYDISGKRTAMIMPNGDRVDYGYDSAGRLSGIDSFAGHIGFGYDTAGRRTSLDFPNNITTSYSYDQLGRMTSLVSSDGSQIVAGFNYSHDAVGNRLSKQVTGSKLIPDHSRYDYGYDAVYQLVQALPVDLKGKKGKIRKNEAELFGYDPVGNRLTGPRRQDYAEYNNSNQLLVNNAYDYQYDNNGNLISKAGADSTWSYQYDYENRLVQVIKVENDQETVVSFRYDPFGRRIEKQVEKTGEEAHVLTYLYDNEDIIEISDNRGSSKGKGRGADKTTRILHGPGIDEPLAIMQKGELYYYHADGLGSIVGITDAKGRIAEGFEYTSFGETKRHGNKVKQPYGYTAREWDQGIGLYFYRARYYDPEVGRFVGKDPIGFNGGDVNLYGYVGNDPVDWIDPEGFVKRGLNYKPNWRGRSDGSNPSGQAPISSENNPTITPTPDSGVLDYPYGPNSLQKQDSGYCNPCTPTFHPCVYWNCVALQVLGDHIATYATAFVAMAMPSGVSQIGGALGSIALSNYIGYYCRNKATYCD